MRERYNELRKIHTVADSVRFLAKEFGIKPISVCDLLGLDSTFLIQRSWE